MPPSGVLSLILKQNRAMWFFKGTAKYTSTAAIFGEMTWRPAEIKQWKCISANWARFVNMKAPRVNKRTFQWSYEQSSRSCKNIVFRIKDHFNVHGFGHFFDISSPVPLKSFPISLCDKMMEKHSQDWAYALNSDSSRRGNGANKLRGSTVGFLFLQCSSGVVRHPGDLRMSVATRSCRVLIFASL